MKSMLYRFFILELFISSFTVTNSSAQCPQSSSNIDPGFGEDCSSCVGVPCNLCSVSNASVVGVNYNYVEIFHDEFTGSVLDISKWVTSVQSGVHGSTDGSTIDYDNAQNYQFDHGGIELLLKYNSTPFTAWPVDWDHSYAERSYNYTSSNLNSEYQFPLFNNRYSAPYGIYRFTGILPEIQPYNGGASLEPPYGRDLSGPITGMIWPAFWMWGIDDLGNYGEIDGFEFPKDPEEDFQTTHYPQPPQNGPQYQCQSADLQTTFGHGEQHTYTIIYTPDEIDWYVDNINTRSDTKYYGLDDDFLSDDVYFPLYSTTNITSGSLDIDQAYQNYNFPFNVPMYLVINNAVQPTALSQYFPISLMISSVQYWAPGDCSASIDVTNSDIHNYNTLVFNEFTGKDVTIDGVTDGAIDIPNLRTITTSPDKGWCHGNLEAIGQSSITIKGSFTNSGYLVLKADPNICEEYHGPTPFDVPTSAMSKKGNSQGKEPNTITTQLNDSLKQALDSLTMEVKQSATSGEFSVSLKNVTDNELNQMADITIWNTLGQIIQNKQMFIQKGQEVPFNLSNAARGMYIIVVKTQDKILHGKVILQ